MKRTILLAIPLAACSSLADPTYAQPTDAEAKTAFIAGQLSDADLLDGRPVPKASESPVVAVAEIQGMGAARDEFRNDGTVDILRKTKPFDRVAVTNCAWERIDKDQVWELSRARVGDNPSGAYHCDEEIFVTQQYGIKAKAVSRGYFFKNAAGQWSHLPEDALHYEQI